MEALKVTVQSLAVYLMAVSLMGTISQIWNFASFASSALLVQELAPCNGSSTCNNVTFQGGQLDEIYQQRSTSQWSNFVICLDLLYEYTFPVIIPVFPRAKGANEHLQNAYSPEVLAKLHSSQEIYMSSFLATLLPSFFLLKGTFKINYSNCKFWYYTQVGSLLLSCLRMVLMTFLDLWDVTTNGILIAVLLGLFQLWLVQSFIERIERQAKNQQQNKFVSQLLALNDLHSLESYKIVDECGDDNDKHCNKSYTELNLI